MHGEARSRWTSSAPGRDSGDIGALSPNTEAPLSRPAPAARAVRTFLAALIALLALHVSLNAALNSSGELRNDGLLISTVRASESHQKARALDAFIARRAEAPMGVVLGSSRVMELSLSDSAATIPFYNCGVSGGKAEDILAFARFILRHPRVRVAEAVIGVDPFALAVPNDPVDYGARLRGVHQLESVMHDRIRARRRWKWRASALLGRDWTTAVREIGDPPGPSWFDAAGVYPESNYVKRVGTSPDSRARYLSGHISMVMGHLPDTPEPDPRRVWDVSETVRLLRAHGARVTIFLPPTHPRLLAALRNDPAFLTQIADDRTILQALASHTGATFVDLTDPARAGLAPSDFWDGYHYTSAAATLVARSLGAAGDPPPPGPAPIRATLTVR